MQKDDVKIDVFTDDQIKQMLNFYRRIKQREKSYFAYRDYMIIVTPNTISRNLRKLKEKCSDLLKITQNRNFEEKFAALIFEFQCISEGNIGCISEPVNDNNDSQEVAEITPSNSSTYPLVLSGNTNKDLNINIVKQEDVQQDSIIFDTYLEFKKKGIEKPLFNKVLAQVRKKKEIKNFRAYLRGALKKVIGHIDSKKNVTTEEETRPEINILNILYYYDWVGGE
jgi:hypothetical protein